MKRCLERSDDAASQVLSFLVGLSVLVAAIGTLLLSADTASGAPATHLDVQAAGVLDTLAAPGAGQQGDLRLRLGAPGGVHLDPGVLATFRGAGAGTDATNGIIDYEEAKQRMGLAGRGFHLTVAPTGLADELAAMDLGGIRAAYIGHWSPSPSAVVASGTDEGMAQAGRAAVDAQAAAVGLAERDALADLGLGYADRVDLSTTALPITVEGEGHITGSVASGVLRGDVWVDDKQHLDMLLAHRLEGLDLLVVGSGVQHNALTSDAVKSAVRDWVMGGGTLFVMGSPSQSTQWLQPLFHVGTANVNGGAYAPHSSHPMLQEPHVLAWTQYEAPAKVWEVGERGARAGEDDFDHILVAGDGDALAISRPGAFGSGTILLTAYQPGAFTEAPGETRSFLHNAIVYMDRSHLFLDYGPGVPEGAAVGSAMRHGLLHDEQLGDVTVRIQLLLWGGSS